MNKNSQRIVAFAFLTAFSSCDFQFESSVSKTLDREMTQILSSQEEFFSHRDRLTEKPLSIRLTSLTLNFFYIPQLRKNGRHTSNLISGLTPMIWRPMGKK